MRKVTADDFSRTQKAEHVKSAKFTGGHTCHWPGCTKEVKPAMWGCAPHWFKLPTALRNKIWATYKPGQEDTKTPSLEYIETAKEAQAWIEKNAR